MEYSQGQWISLLHAANDHNTEGAPPISDLTDLKKPAMGPPLHPSLRGKSVAELGGPSASPSGTATEMDGLGSTFHRARLFTCFFSTRDVLLGILGYLRGMKSDEIQGPGCYFVCCCCHERQVRQNPRLRICCALCVVFQGLHDPLEQQHLVRSVIIFLHGEQKSTQAIPLCLR